MKLTAKSKFGISVAVLTFSLFAGSPVRAQAPAKADPPANAPAAALPSSDDVIRHYVQAVGGAEALKKFTSRQIIGTLEIPRMSVSGTLESHEKAPNKMMSVVVVAGATFKRGFDGTIGWADDPQNGLRDLTGDELTDTKREADFYRPLDLQKIYSKISVQGTDKVGDHDAYVVEASTGSGDPDKLFFDKTSGLLIHSVLTQHTPQGAVTVEEDLGDYQDADGEKIPFTIKQSTPQIEFTIKISEVHHNVQFDDAQFAKPAAE